MRVRRIISWEEFFQLADQWNPLLVRSKADSIFLTWEWLEAWVGIFSGICQPHAITVWDEKGNLAGVAPLYRAAYTLFLRLPTCGLRFMADNVGGAEYPDWILRQDLEEEAAHAIAHALTASGDLWDFIWMANLSGWGGARDRITGSCREAGLAVRWREREFSSFPLPRSFEAYLATLSANRRSQLSRQTRQVLSREGIAFQRCQNRDEVPRYLDGLFALHNKRWAEAGLSGTFARRPEAMQFYRRFVPKALERGWLRLYALEERGSFKAVQIGYVYKNVYCQLQEGYDPAHVPGIGNVLRLHLIEECIKEGVEEYDFLGEMTEHKRRWGAQLRKGSDMMITSGSVIGRMLSRIPVWPTGRFLRQASATVRERED